MNLEKEILNLIDSKREGSYWDFKKEHHTSKASLLHDILCLSNSLYSGNKYLIYGVADPGEGCEIVGLTNDNRKTQAQLIDFLDSKSFAGDYRPEIALQTLVVADKTIDVLVIFDHPLKPYYLTEDYQEKANSSNKKTVKSNYIYTRTNDKNTSISKSADIGIIEKMWKQRFGLDLSPLEYMKQLLLQPNEWFKDIGNKPYAYHIQYPNFRINFSDNLREYSDTYSFFYPNERSFVGDATFKYDSTTLFELEYMFCDNGGIEFSVPDIEIVKIKNTDNWFYYYVLNELKGLFLYFITDGITRLYSRNSTFPYILFKDEIEKMEFKEYLESDKNIFDNIEQSNAGYLADSAILRENRNPTIDPIFIDKVLQLHKIWLENKEATQKTLYDNLCYNPYNKNIRQ